MKYSIFKRKGTKLSIFAMIRDSYLENGVGMRPLAKIERCQIGKGSYLGTLSAAYDTKIGRYCSIARECYIGGAQHPLDRVSTSGCFYLKSNYSGICYYEDDFKWQTSTEIGNDVWLGIRTIVVGGVKISDGAVIGAGSVVTKDVGPYEIWAGNPARFIRKRFEDETIEKLLKSEWWNWDEDKLIKEGYKFVSPDNLFENK